MPAQLTSTLLLRRASSRSCALNRALPTARHLSTFPLVNDASAWAARRCDGASLDERGYFAFYSSATDAITTNPALMHVPIDDHAIVRGHAVFDTCCITPNGRLYRLDTHLDRLFSSAAQARIPLPFGPAESENRAKMIEIVRAVALASGQTDCDIRYWLTAGTGNLGVTPSGCTPGFYVLAFGGLPKDPAWETEGIPEASVPSDLVPLKPKFLAEIKSNNYLLNALMMMAAKDRGGTFGIGVGSDGYILESAVLNAVVVGKDRILRTPPFEHLLRGCTIRRTMQLAEEQLVPSGLIKGVSQEPIPLSDAYEADELFLVAGDTHMYAITSLDGHAIGAGTPGPVKAQMQRMLHEDAAHGTADHVELVG